MSKVSHHHAKHQNVWKKRLGIATALVAGLLGLRVLTAQFTWLQLPDKLQDLITLATSVIIESIPFVILGILLSVLLQVWLPGNTIERFLPQWGLLRRACISFLGVFLPVCECGNVPLARGLMIRGFTVAESLTFLLAAPILNPITIITTHQAFGGDNTILIARIAGGFLIANIIGWIYSTHKNPHRLLTDEFAAVCEKPETEHEHKRTDKSITIFAKESSNMLPALFVGAFIAGLIQVLVPREVLLSLGSDPILSILAMMILAFIVAICSNVDAFFALAFKNTFTTGSLVSFLTFGPIIDIKMLALMRTTYKLRVLLQITVLVALMSAILGLAVNYAF